MTEGGAVCTRWTRAAFRTSCTVGRPVPGHEIRVIDDEGELPPGSVGELVGCSGLTDDRLPQPAGKDARSRMVSTPTRRAIRTGDVGRLDEDFLVLMDGPQEGHADLRRL